MRTLIFTLMLMALNCFGAPQPGVWLNPFTTNRPPMRVFGDNNISISNRVAGPGGGTNWNFYGIGAETVARLLDATNIARSVVSSSNGLYVLRINGGSTGQMATNFTAISNAAISSVGPQLNFVSTDGAAMDDISVYQDSSLSALIFTNQDSGLLARIDGGGVYSSQFDANILYQINGNTVLSDNPAHQLNIGFGAYWTSILIGPTANGTTNAGYFENAGTFTNWGNATFKIPSASKLAALDANKVLTNSVYSDADIAALQTATNVFIRTNSGTGFFTTLYSPTNTAQASNQVPSTINGSTGQSTNLFEAKTNQVSTKTVIDAQGRIGVNTNVPNQALHVNGNVLVSGTGIITNVAMYSSGVTENAGTKSRNTSIGYDSANTISFTGSSGILAFLNSALSQFGVNTNCFGSSAGVPNGSLEASNAVFRGLLTGNVGISTLRSNLLAPTAITFPNSTVNWTNPLNCNIELYIDNTAVTGTAIKKNGTQIFGGLSNDVVMHLQPGEFFSETYSVGTPSATFSPF